MTGASIESSIMIVEDDPFAGPATRRLLLMSGFRVSEVVSHSDKVISAVQRHRPDAVVMDITLPGELDGIALAEEIQVREDVPVVLLSAMADARAVARAARSGAYGFFTKPASAITLATTIRLAITKHADVRACRVAKAKLAQTLDAIDAGIVVFGSTGEVAFMNRVASLLTGCTLSEATVHRPRWVSVLAKLGPSERADGLLAEQRDGYGLVCRAFEMDGGQKLCILRDARVDVSL
jgi:FixJ family two-component response regulator